MTGSAIYTGHVMHRRVRPRVHKLRYRMFSLLLDLDEIDGLTQSLHLFSRGRFNLFAFHDRDHGAGTAEPLRAQVEAHLTAAGITLDGGAIRLLTMPRLLGFAFNPLSVYFCHRADGALVAILYEVNNTFGQRHSYLLPVTEGLTTPIRQTTPKRFHVSPFMAMDMTYDFRVLPPAERLVISIAVSDGGGRTMMALHQATRRPLTDPALARAAIVYPLLTLKVVAGILWEALKLWLKGLAVHRLPLPPDTPVTSPLAQI